MPYNSNISDSDADALIPEDVSEEIIESVPEQSAVFSMGMRLPDMATNQRRMPILSVLPYAYFVNGNTGLKQTTRMAWDNKYIDAEEVAVIVPIAENVLDDTGYPIWDQVRPRIIEAFGAKIDGAIFFGDDAPTDWPDDLYTAAVAAGNYITRGDGVDLYDEIMAEDGVIAAVEEDGFFVTGHGADISMRSKLRGLRTDDGSPIFNQDMQGATRYALDGSPMFFPRNGAWDRTKALQISGDFDQLVYAMRKDITFKLLDQAVITDNSTPPQIIFNLPQQDMVALRCVMRLGWNVPNPIKLLNTDDDTRFPFSVLKPAAGSGSGS